jgi:hypothetical protein
LVLDRINQLIPLVFGAFGVKLVGFGMSVTCLVSGESRAWFASHRLVTLRDAALYITKLPKAEHDAEEWQASMQALLLVAEHDGPTMFARIGMMRALRRHEARPSPAPRRKRAKAYQIIR